MNTIFSKAEHIHHNKTFLLDIVIEYNFEPVAEDGDLDNRFKEFLHNSFGINTEGLSFVGGEHSLRKDDGSLSFYFSNGRVATKIGGQAYFNFIETARPTIYKIREFLEQVLDLKTLENIKIKKTNCWPFINEAPSLNDKKIRDDLRLFVFSEQLQESLKADKDEKATGLIEDLKTYSFSNDDFSIKLRSYTALHKGNDDIQKNYINLFLDIIGTLATNGGIKIDDIEDETTSLNNEIYNCFQWCISDKIREIMD